MKTIKGAATKYFTGQYEVFPDLTGKRIEEGGRRLIGAFNKTTTDKPLISIVTVVYNAEKTLKRTIESVIKQTYKNIEYIIIDGGSTDSSLNIIRGFDTKLEYYISEPDNGIYHAMNKGISLAKGDYICLLNADDFYSDEFVSESVNIALKTGADIVYSDMNMFGEETYAEEINSGIYIHYLNINHLTFLTSKEAYNQIGPYREDYKIVSDVIWARSAFKSNLKFIHLKKCMFYFTEGGLSDANNDERRILLINEAGQSCRIIFPFITQEEARELYLSRFNIGRVDILHKLYSRYADKEPLFKTALREYLMFMLTHKFVFKEKDIVRYLPEYRNLCKKLKIDYSNFNIIHNDYDIKGVLARISNISKDINKENGSATCLIHFVSKFSSPSETFIYDLITRVETEKDKNNIVLCDERTLSEERPYDNCIEIAWESLPCAIREMLYEYLFSTIRPDVVIAHFALNGWKLHQRILPLGIEVPMVHMMHGIDVFFISTKKSYQNYILNEASVNPNVSFTAVSKYLLREGVQRGIPEEKISLIPNVVHDRYFKNRKCSNYYDGSRKLEVLNVGRLIDWKGHSELIDGLDYFVNNVSDNIHLTILYAKSGSTLEVLGQKIDMLGLTEKVSLIDFVNFNEQPDYYTNFDLFVSSSKYTEGAAKRSETFGMSTLEAIAAGLPVIVTDAGGSPEVVGDENIFAKIVPHADGLAIGKAMESFVNDGKCFADNLRYAKERLTKFSAEQQLKQFAEVVEQVTAVKTKVGIFSSIIQAGAGAAAARVHKAIMMHGIDSAFFTRDINTVVPKEPNYNFLAPEIGLKWDMMQSSGHARPGYTIFSLNEPALRRKTLQQLTQDMDIVNLNWIARFLTAEDIGYLSNLGKPVVMTVRDMHPLTGGCHSFHDCDRWMTDCYGCPQLVGDEDHFPAKVLAIKKHYWNMANISFVALSQHTERIIKQSALYNGNRIEVIANPVELDVFSPTPKEKARKYFGIKSKTPLLFYIPSYGSRVKGAHEFKDALHYIKEKYPDFRLTLIMAGSATSLVKKSEYFFPIVHLGSFSDNELLAKAYSAADATVIPSLEETFSNTAAESVSCGTPIIGFKTGAIPDITGDGLRGESVTVGDVKALGESIYSVLKQFEADISCGFSEECREYAKKNFSFKEQGRKYAAFFNELKHTSRQSVMVNPEEVPLIDASIVEDVYRWQAKVAQLNVKTNKPVKKQVAEFKKHFVSLCKVNVYKNPMQKIERYKSLMKMWNAYKGNKLHGIHGSSDFVDVFEELCSVSLIKNPLKKLNSYKKLLSVWHKNKRKI